MNPNQTQSNIEPNTASANLGFINTMQEQLLQHKAKKAGVQPKVASQPQQSNPQPEQKETKTSPKEEKTEGVSEKMSEFELNMTKQLDALRKEMKDDQQREMDRLKQTIQDALANEDGKN